MKKFRAHVKIRYKTGILDPQAEATLAALHRLQFLAVKSVEFDKDLVLSLEASSSAEAETLAKQMAEKLLVNPVMEDYRIQIEAEG